MTVYLYDPKCYQQCSNLEKHARLIKLMVHFCLLPVGVTPKENTRLTIKLKNFKMLPVHEHFCLNQFRCCRFSPALLVV